MLSKYEGTLLGGWEDIHKKSQLTLWIMLALKDSPKHMADIKNFISNITNNLISADDQSMYRALRRFNDADLVTYKTEVSKGAPDKKIYELTDIGKNVLSEFIKRNIKDIFYKSEVKNIINKRP